MVLKMVPKDRDDWFADAARFRDQIAGVLRATGSIGRPFKDAGLFGATRGRHRRRLAGGSAAIAGAVFPVMGPLARPYRTRLKKRFQRMAENHSLGPPAMEM